MLLKAQFWPDNQAFGPVLAKAVQKQECL